MRSYDRGLREALEDFGSRIEAIRKLQGLSRMALADIADLHPNTVANIERGFVDGSIIAASHIIVNLGCEGVIVTARGFDPIFTEGNLPANAFPGLKINKPFIAASIGQVVRRRRLELGASVEDIAEYAGIHRNTLGNVEQGIVEPSIGTIYRIYRSLEVRSVIGSNVGIRLI